MTCPNCGEVLSENATFCANCGTKLISEPNTQNSEIPTTETYAPTKEAPAQKPENVLTGIVGALLGAAIGAGAIILLSRLGFVASISGFILAVCTLKGYELLAGRISAKGIVIGIILLLVTPYIADRLDWAFVIMKEYAGEGITFGQAFAVVPALVEEGAIKESSYITNLLMLYGFTIFGAFSTFKGSVKKKK